MYLVGTAWGTECRSYTAGFRYVPRRAVGQVCRFVIPFQSLVLRAMYEYYSCRDGHVKRLEGIICLIIKAGLFFMGRQ